MTNTVKAKFLWQKATWTWTSNHQSLSNLAWANSWHTGTASKVAWFDVDWKPTYYDAWWVWPSTELDGGFIATNYLLLQAVDAWFASSVFTSAELIDWWNA
jgi:hypothetical protein